MKDYTSFLTALCTCCVLAVLPKATLAQNPIIKLSFDEASGVAPLNSGTASATFVRSNLTPARSTNVPLQDGNVSSLDFGVTPGNYFVESSTIVPALQNLSAFTITGWVNARSNVTGSGGNRIISWINNGGNGVDLVYQSNGSLRLGVDGWPDFSPAFSSPSKIPNNAAVPASNWTFFAVTYQSNGQVQFYFGNNTADATLDVTRTYTAPGVTGTNIGKLAIGSFNSATRNTSTYDRMFKGMIDNVKVYGSVLNLSSIVAAQREGAGDIVPPSAPPFLTVNARTNTTVSLSWVGSTDNVGVTGYAIYNGSTLLALVGNVSDYTLTGLMPGTSYSLTLKARDAANNYSAASGVVHIITDQTAVLPLIYLTASSTYEEHGNRGTLGGTFYSSHTDVRENAPPRVGEPYSYETAFGHPYAGLGGLNAFTLTGWINSTVIPTGSSGNKIISWLGEGDEGVELIVQPDGSLRLGVNSQPEASPAFSSPNKIPMDASTPVSNWVFFAVTYEAFGETKFYFGNSTTSVSPDVTRSYPGPGPVGSNGSNVYIGGGGGLTDEPRVYPAVLSLQEMATIQYGPADTTPPTAPGGLSLISKTETSVSLEWATSSTDNIEVIGHALFNGTTLLSKAYPHPKSPPEWISAIGLTPGTTYMLTLRGFDVKGNYSEPSNVVVVTTLGNAATAPIIDLRLEAGSGSSERNLGLAPVNFYRSAGTPSGTENIPTGVIGTRAADFGTVIGDYYIESTAPIDGLKNLSAFTLTGWVNNRSNVVGPGGNRIISWINNGGDGVDLVYQANGSLRLGVDGSPDLSPAFSSINKVPTNSAAPASNWVFFAVTYQSNGQVQFYFGNNTTDAVLDVVKTYSGPGVTGSNIGNLAIGSFNNATRGPGTYDRMFKGLIDNITVHGKILSPAEIVGVQRSAGADTTPPPAPTSLVAQSVTVSSVTLHWQVPQDQSDIAMYVITGNTNAGQFTASSSVTPFHYPGLNANTTHTFFVQSKDRAGNLSEPSNTITVTTLSAQSPLIKLALDETSGVNPVNVGSLSSSFTRSSGIPVSSTMAARGSGSFGFDVNAGNYYVESPGVINGLKNLSAFTITGWINNQVSVAGSGGNRIVSWINNGGDGVDLVYQSNGTLRLGVDQWPDYSPAVSSTNKVTTLNNPTLQATNWIFFAVTYKSNGQVEYYFGKPDALATLDVTRSYAGRGITGSNISKLALGNFNSATRNPYTYDRMFRGFMDDIQIFGSALSLDEIISIQQEGLYNSARQSTSSVARYESETVLPEEGEEMTKLFQNYPNPFASETTIDLYIPHAAKVARVIVNDLSGRSLKNIEVTGRGKTSVTIGSGDMNNGMYFYSLLVDGETQGTKRMAITK